MIHLLRRAYYKERRAVHTVRNEITGTITSESWYTGDGKLDRADGPATISRDAVTGDLIREGWYKNGKRFLPSTELRMIWLKNSSERIDASAARKAAWISKIGEELTYSQ